MLKRCESVTKTGKKCKKNTINEKFCMFHDYNFDDCPICFDKKKLFKLNCCEHYFCINCIPKINKCGLCRAKIILTKTDDKKISVCNKMLDILEEFYNDELTENNQILYLQCENFLFISLKQVSNNIKNNYYKNKIKKKIKILKNNFYFSLNEQ